MTFPPRVPDGWLLTTLGDQFRWGSGGTPRRSESAFFGGDIPWAIIGDLNDGVVTATSGSLTQAGLENSAAKWIEPGSVLVAMYGSIGKLGIAGVRMTCNQAIAFADPDGVPPKYLFYYLAYVRAHLIHAGKGGTQRNISQEVLKRVPFLLAPANQRRAIADKLDELFSDLDAGVATLKHAKANLARYRAAVLKAAVEGRLTEQWRREHPDVEPASELLDRILAERRKKWEEECLARYGVNGKKPPKDWREKYTDPRPAQASDLPPLPRSWCWTTIDHLAWYVRNGLPKKPASEPPGVRILRISAVRSMSVDLDDVRYYRDEPESLEPYHVRDGDLLFTRYNGSVDLLGVAGLVRGCGKPTLHPDKLIRVRFAGASSIAEFVEIAANVGESRNHILRRARTTAGQTGVSGADIRQMPIPLPPEAEQQAIREAVDVQMATWQRAGQQMATAQQRAVRLRAGILNAAFSGNLLR